MGKDGVAMCSGPEEGEVSQVKLCVCVRVCVCGVGDYGIEVIVARKVNSVTFTFPCPCPKVEETASASRCQLWPLSSGCGELPQVAMLTPPQECESEIPDVDTCGPGIQPA